MNSIRSNFDVLYVAMSLTIVGQCVCGNNLFLGQGLFLVANLIYLCRDFVLRRPVADKVKNTLFTAITIGIILINLLR